MLIVLMFRILYELKQQTRFKDISIKVSKVYGAFVKDMMASLLSLLSSFASPPLDSDQFPFGRRIGYWTRCLLSAIDIIYQNSIEE